MTPGFEQSLQQALKHWPRDFSLALVSHWGAAPFADSSILRVRGNGDGELSVTRGQYDQPQAIGRFAGRIDDALVLAAARALARFRFAELVSKEPAGAAVTTVELTASGAATSLPLSAFQGQGDAETQLLTALFALEPALRSHPAAALALRLAKEEREFLLTFARLGPDTLLAPNPLFTGGDTAPFLALELGIRGTEGLTWETVDVPLAGTVFETGGRLVPLPPSMTTRIAVSPSLLEQAIVARVRYGSYERPPNLRIGGIDVFGRVVASNELERDATGGWR